VEVHQFSTSLTYGDAISDEILEIRKALRERGLGSEIFVRFFEPRMAGYIHDFREYPRFSAAGNVVIFHFSIGSPVSKMFLRIPDKRILIYHNITPYDYFLDSHRILTRECYKGRLELDQFKDKINLALGDSDFNRRELAEAGYPRTGVLPILLDFAKFDVPGDPVVRSIFAEPKTTILYVGRIIPNKKFEDVIKTFYIYKKEFNRNARLILAGDFRGMERYLAALQDLIDRLALDDVHLTGHVDFEELVAYYRLADVYLSMSEHEGFGVPLLEAFHLKIPVVAFAAGAVEETMSGGGVLLRRKDFLRTAALIDRIVQDRALRERIVTGQLKALAKYSRANVSRILFDHIDGVVRS
jgi:glycosyltransferase involved in cell wall biosynthesis